MRNWKLVLMVVVGVGATILGAYVIENIGIWLVGYGWHIKFLVGLGGGVALVVLGITSVVGAGFALLGNANKFPRWMWKSESEKGGKCERDTGNA